MIWCGNCGYWSGSQYQMALHKLVDCRGNNGVGRAPLFIPPKMRPRFRENPKQGVRRE